MTESLCRISSPIQQHFEPKMSVKLIFIKFETEWHHSQMTSMFLSVKCEQHSLFTEEKYCKTVKLYVKVNFILFDWSVLKLCSFGASDILLYCAFTFTGP